MKKSTLFAALTAVMIMSGCSSSSGDSSDSNTSNSNVGSPSGNSGGGSSSAIVAYSCEDSKSNNGQSFEVKSGYSGDIIYNCKMKGEDFGYSLKSGVGSLTVTDIVRVANVQESCKDGSGGSGTVTFNYKQNSVTYVGYSNKDGKINCKELYNDMGLPAVFTSKESIETLLEFDTAESKDSPKLVSSSCPDWNYDEVDDSSSRCSGTIVENITITDDSNTIHKLSIETKFSY